MKWKIAVSVILLLSLFVNTTYIGVPAVKTPLAPSLSHYLPRLTVEDISLPDLNTPVLKQVTPADMQTLDLRQPCGFTSTEIESVTKYNFCGLGANFAEQDNKVNAIFLLSVAALESGWGRYNLYEYNLFGMYHYHPQSYAECINHVADYLATNYLTAGSELYNGITVTAVNTNYCLNSDGTPDTSWTDQLSVIMADMYNQIYMSEYQQAI